MINLLLNKQYELDMEEVKLEAKQELIKELIEEASLIKEAKEKEINIKEVQEKAFKDGVAAKAMRAQVKRGM